MCAFFAAGNMLNAKYKLGKRQKIIADSCQEFQEEWWDLHGFALL